jgi:hypothetical protein
LDLGTPPHAVREIVGHSDIGLTMSIYAHASLAEKRRAIERLGDELQDVAVIGPDKRRPADILAGQWWWAGAGSNRRPSAFQADAHTD